MFWGDCSLANTLLMRDGQRLQAYLVDAETSEIHDRLSNGQREADLEIAIENVAGDLADLGILNGKTMEELDDDFEAALSLRERTRVYGECSTRTSRWSPTSATAWTNACTTSTSSATSWTSSSSSRVRMERAICACGWRWPG